MRIAAIVHQFPPHFETGTEILCLRTMQAHAARGHQLRVFAADPLRPAGAPPREETVDGVAVTFIATAWPRRLALAARLGDEFANPKAEAALIEGLRRFAPEAIHVFHLRQWGLAAAPALAAIAPTVMTATDFHLACPQAIGGYEDGRPCAGPEAEGGNCLAHAEALEEARARRSPAIALRGILSRLTPGLDGRQERAAAAWARREASARALRSAARLLAGSVRIRAMLLAAGARPERLFLEPHGAPPLDIPARDMGPVPVAAFFGTLARHKGAHVFLDALARLPADLPLRAIIAGPPGPDAAYADDIARRAAADPRIEMRPPAANAAFGALLSEADIVVLPSLWDENRPLTLLNALEAGRYAVASDVPGLAAEITPGRTGALFPPGDADALAAILTRLAEAPEPVRAARAHPRPSAFGAYVDAVERHLLDAVREAAR